MSKSIHDRDYADLLKWLKNERLRLNRETGGAFTMRALAPKLAKLLGRPGITFSWIGKVEQCERRLDLLEYVAYCLALGIDPHEGVSRITGLFPENAPERRCSTMVSTSRGVAAKVRLGNLKTCVRGMCRDVRRVLRTQDAGRVGSDILRPASRVLRPSIGGMG